MYRYEAFFSYKRHPLTDEWHRELMTRIQYWLSQDLGIQDVPIFFDTRSIPNGMLFSQEIDDALRASKVIVSIMSPLYFRRAYLFSEDIHPLLFLLEFWGEPGLSFSASTSWGIPSASVRHMPG